MFPGAGGLKPEHLQRLLQGAWSLSGYWQRLLAEIPGLPSGAAAAASASGACHTTFHAGRCRPQWERVWQAAAARGSASDVVQKLKYISTEMRSTATFTNPPCGAQGHVVVDSLITQLETTFADHFLGFQ
jgi:hypothetical protein